MAELSREESNRMRSIGRETAARIARIAETAARSYGMSRSFATVSKVNSDGTVEVNFGNAAHAMNVGSVRTTTDCACVKVGDVVVVDTFAYVPLVTGIVSTGKNGVLPVSHGGTGATSAAGARNALGLGNTTGALPIANGGTGATTAAGAFKNLSGYTLDLGTNNTTDTWVPVMKSGTIQHRVLPTLPFPVSAGGTGQTSLQATRNAMGLGNTTGALPISNGGTGATSAAQAAANLGGHNLAKQSLTGQYTSNLNTCEPGVYHYTSNTTGRPNDWGVCVCIFNSDSKWKFQLALPTSGDPYWRRNINGAGWTKWWTWTTA